MIPLAERIRPDSLEYVFGQEHLLSKNAPLRKIIEGGSIPNMIFYGPSGTGKTTVANIIAKRAGMTMRRLNATTASSDDIKDIRAQTATMFGSGGVLLFLDEIQYFNKRQQQTLLEYIEDGRITLIASTTENPFFYVYRAIVSRSTVFEFKPLNSDGVKQALNRALSYLNRENGRSKTAAADALETIASRCGGDVRAAINSLELAYHSCDTQIDSKTASSLIGHSYMGFDRNDDNHYELLSALQKSIRGSDENAAVFYLAKLLEGGDLISACRRLLVIASEDIGLAYPMAAVVTKACVDSALQLGLPEARIPLAQAAILLATSPKSNSAYIALDAATEDIRRGLGRDMPMCLKNNHCMSDGEIKDGYKYPHDYPMSYVEQQYLPDDIKNKKYYTFGNNKTEKAAQEYRNKILETIKNKG